MPGQLLHCGTWAVTFSASHVSGTWWCKPCCLQVWMSLNHEVAVGGTSCSSPCFNGKNQKTPVKHGNCWLLSCKGNSLLYLHCNGSLLSRLALYLLVFRINQDLAFIFFFIDRLKTFFKLSAGAFSVSQKEVTNLFWI